MTSISDVYKQAAAALAKQGVLLEFIYTIQGHLKIILKVGRHVTGLMLKNSQLNPETVDAAINEGVQDLAFQVQAVGMEVACAGS